MLLAAFCEEALTPGHDFSHAYATHYVEKFTTWLMPPYRVMTPA